MEGTFLWLSFWNGRRGKRNIFGLKQPPKTGLINRLHDSETKPDITFLSGSTTLPGFNLLWMQPDWLEQRGILYLRMTTWKITSSTCSLFGGTLLRKQNKRVVETFVPLPSFLDRCSLEMFATSQFTQRSRFHFLLFPKKNPKTIIFFQIIS